MDTEAQIIQLLVKGDQKAISLLYDHYSGALYGYALRLVGSEAAARDVLQASFIKIWKNGDSYHPKKAKLYSWLVSIVRNTALDHLRKTDIKLNREIRQGDYAIDIGTDQIVPEHIDIKKHVTDLDEKYRAVIYALYFQGLSQSEASKELGVPLGTIKTRVKIGIRELRKIYVDHTLELVLLLWCIGQQP